MYDKGVRFWYDEGLPPGVEWDKKVREQIGNPNCCGVIFYISKKRTINTTVTA